jgi:dienelactone hydrolase
METPIVFTVRGQQVVGMLHQPGAGGTDRVPGVLFLHGFTGNKQEPHRLFVAIARELARRGMVSLRIDFRGSGDSEGEFVDASVTSELEDARAALAFLRAQPGGDPERPGGGGMSMGGLIASLLLAGEPRVPAAVLICPLGDTKAVIAREGGAIPLKSLRKDGCFDRRGSLVGRAFIEEMMASRPAEEIAKSNAAVLLLHGDRDESIEVRDSKLYEAALRKAGREVACHIIEGANHTFDAVPWVRELVDRSTDWLEDRLLG